jgi:hypothetical protein
MRSSSSYLFPRTRTARGLALTLMLDQKTDGAIEALVTRMDGETMAIEQAHRAICGRQA